VGEEFGDEGLQACPRTVLATVPVAASSK